MPSAFAVFSLTTNSNLLKAQVIWQDLRLCTPQYRQVSDEVRVRHQSQGRKSKALKIKVSANLLSLGEAELGKAFGYELCKYTLPPTPFISRHALRS